MAEALVRAAPYGTVCALLLASQRKESGEWLQAPPMSSPGLHMDDEVMRVAVGLRLGPRCAGHTSVTSVVLMWTIWLCMHSLSCRKSQGWHSRHAAMNDLLNKRSLASAKIPSILEPTGMAHSDGKRPDGTSVMPWKCGRTLFWDATCPDTFAPSHACGPCSKGSRFGG